MSLLFLLLMPAFAWDLQADYAAFKRDWEAVNTLVAEAPRLERKALYDQLREAKRRACLKVPRGGWDGCKPTDRSLEYGRAALIITEKAVIEASGMDKIRSGQVLKVGEKK